MTRPTFQPTLIDDSSLAFYVEWLGEDGQAYGSAFPVRDNQAQPDQHAYAVQCVEGFLRDKAPVHDRAAEPTEETPNPEPGEPPPE